MFAAIDIRADLKPLQRAFIALGAEQVPFATSLALNSLAKGVAEVERAAIDATFKSPTPFTENAYRIIVATKSRPIARVAAKDIQSAYLTPYVDGGDRYLGAKRGMLVPRGVGLNQYGNLPKSKLASLKGKPNIFIGPIKTRAGKIVNGVWQRPNAGVGRARPRKGAAPAPRGPLKLLIQFEDTTPAPKHLDFEAVAVRYIRANAAREFKAALQRAFATRRK